MRSKWKITAGSDVGWRVWKGENLRAVFTRWQDALAYVQWKTGR